MNIKITNKAALRFRDERKMSGLLKMALDDLKFVKEGRYKKVKKFKKYPRIRPRINMGTWFTTVSKKIFYENERIPTKRLKGICYICLAGSVMFRRLVPPAEIGVNCFEPNDFYNEYPCNYEVSEALKIVDTIRNGCLLTALDKLNYSREDKNNLMPQLCKIKITEAMQEYPQRHLKKWYSVVKQLKALGV